MGFPSAADRTARGRDQAIAGSALCCLGATLAVPAGTVEDGPVVARSVSHGPAGPGCAWRS